MKKSETCLNKSFKKKALNFSSNLPMLILVVVFAIFYFTNTFFDIYGFDYYDFYGNYSLFQELRESAAELQHGVEGYFYSYNFSYNQTSLSEVIFGSLFALVNFDFLLNKKKLYTHLSFAESRKTVFFKKSVLPLLCASLIILSVKLISALANGIYLGVNENLIKGIIANTLTSLMIFTMGYTVTAIAHLFTGRRLEAYAFIASAIVLPYAIESTVANIFTAKLKGYSGDSYMYEPISNEINNFFAYVNPTKYIVDYSTSGEYIPIKDFVSFKDEYIISILWLCIFIGALVLCGKYFCGKFKPENVEKKAKSKIVTIISSVSIPLFFNQAINWISYNAVANPEYLFAIMISTGIFVVTAAAVVISMIITRSAKASLWGAIGGGAIGVLQVICLIIAATGCFGFTTRIPDKEDIASIQVFLPFGDMTYEETNDFFYAYDNTEGILLTEESDFDIVRNIHSSVLEENVDETAIIFDVTYTLKNGRTINRQFENISNSVAKEFLNVWKTQTVQDKLKVILNQAATDYKGYPTYPSYSSQTVHPDLYDINGDIWDSDDLVFAIDPQSVILISKDMQATSLTNISKDENSLPEFNDDRALELMKAIYNDAQVLSAEEWFAPEKELGALAFCEYRYDNESTAAFTIFSVSDAVFYINSNMKNTLAVLDKYDYTKYFECKKDVVSAHLVDVNDLAKWVQSQEFESFEYDEEGLHGTYFSQDNKEINSYIARGCNYDDISILSENGKITGVYIPESVYFESEDSYKLTTKEEITDLDYAKSLVKDAYMAYNVGNHGKFLVVKFTDGTEAMLVVPVRS